MLKIKCPYFPQCGGCLYQDLDDATYVAKKESFVIRSFADKELNPVFNPMIRIGIGTRRRASFAFHHGHFGFNESHTHRIVDLNTCLMLTPALSDFIPTLRQLANTLKGSGDINVLDTPHGFDIHIKMGKKAADLELLEYLTTFAHAHPVARLAFNGMPVLEKVPLGFPSDVFLQPSEEGEKTLINLMLAEVGNAKTAIDLFCGTGTFTRPLLNHGIHATGYDSESASVSYLASNGRVRDLFRQPLITEDFDNIDLVVIDPPRAGASAQVEQLATAKPNKIIMFSCNPITAVRDTKILIDAGWDLSPITPVDQFTYSNHIELCLIFKKATL